MIGVCFGKEKNSPRRVILKIELEINNLNSILSRSAVTPVFPVPFIKFSRSEREREFIRVTYVWSGNGQGL